MGLLELLLFIPLTIILCWAAWKWHRQPFKDNLMFLGFMVLLTSALYSVVILDIRIEGTNLSVQKIEKAKEEIFATKRDISKIAEVVIKSAFVLADGSSRLGGTPAEHKAKLEEYTKELTELTRQNRSELLEEVNKTLQELNDSIKKRARAQ